MTNKTDSLNIGLPTERLMDMVFLPFEFDITVN